MGHGNQIRSAAGSPAHFKSKRMQDFDYSTCFRYVQPIFETADLMIGNLEMTLSNKGKYSGYPMFRTPDAFAYYLKDAGFDLLTTCNNHSNDGFLYGLEHTIDVLDSLELMHTGTFKNQSEKDSLYPLIVEKKVDGTTFRLAFINYTYGTNGIPTTPPAVVNLIEEEAILADIQKAQKAQPDMIIAMTHWGNEYWLDEHKSQQKITKLLWDNGVDLVIGAHPHVIEPIKTDTFWTADSSSYTEKLVAYSLGNFISNQYRKNTDIGLIFEVELVKNSTSGSTIIGHHDYILAWRYIYGRYNSALKQGFDWKYATIPLSAFENDTSNILKMSERETLAMKKAGATMRQHLSKWQSQERLVSFKDLGTIKPIVQNGKKSKKESAASQKETQPFIEPKEEKKQGKKAS
jgi:poly-gamma-glutamate synthesis protein (capsule biosynthesis protein)